MGAKKIGIRRIPHLGTNKTWNNCGYQPCVAWNFNSFVGVSRNVDIPSTKFWAPNVWTPPHTTFFFAWPWGNFLSSQNGPGDLLWQPVLAAPLRMLSCAMDPIHQSLKLQQFLISSDVCSKKHFLHFFQIACEWPCHRCQRLAKWPPKLRSWVWWTDRLIPSRAIWVGKIMIMMDHGMEWGYPRYSHPFSEPQFNQSTIRLFLLDEIFELRKHGSRCGWFCSRYQPVLQQNTWNTWENPHFS